MVLDVPAYIYIGDALARTALASYVIQGRQPHLAAIGFVWNPIPSVLEIPFVLLLHLFGLQQLAGPAVSALAGALCVHTVFQCCRHFEASILIFSGVNGRLRPQPYDASLFGKWYE